jgi:hypothetical protein
MNHYELFIHALKQELLCALPPDIEPQLHHYLKNNDEEEDYITFVSASVRTSGIYPAIPLKPLYEKYIAGASIQNLIADILKALESEKTAPDICPEQFLSFDRIKDHICLKLISRKNNARLLQDTPFISCYDLALVCVYYRAASDHNRTSSALIKNEYLYMWDIDQKTLFEWAVENTPRLMQPHILPVREVLKRMPNMAHTVPHTDMYILSNEDHYLGAVCLFFPGVLEKLADQLQADLILLPSSIHEFIVVPNNGILPPDINEIITSVNQEAVAVSEQLSDHYYYYDRFKKIIKY